MFKEKRILYKTPPEEAANATKSMGEKVTETIGKLQKLKEEAETGLFEVKTKFAEGMAMEMATSTALSSREDFLTELFGNSHEAARQLIGPSKIALLDQYFSKHISNGYKYEGIIYTSDQFGLKWSKEGEIYHTTLEDIFGAQSLEDLNDYISPTLKVAKMVSTMIVPNIEKHYKSLFDKKINRGKILNSSLVKEDVIPFLTDKFERMQNVEFIELKDQKGFTLRAEDEEITILLNDYDKNLNIYYRVEEAEMHQQIEDKYEAEQELRKTKYAIPVATIKEMGIDTRIGKEVIIGQTPNGEDIVSYKNYGEWFSELEPEKKAEEAKKLMDEANKLAKLNPDLGRAHEEAMKATLSLLEDVKSGEIQTFKGMVKRPEYQKVFSNSLNFLKEFSDDEDPDFNVASSLYLNYIEAINHAFLQDRM